MNKHLKCVLRICIHLINFDIPYQKKTVQPVVFRKHLMPKELLRHKAAQKSGRKRYREFYIGTLFYALEGDTYGKLKDTAIHLSRQVNALSTWQLLVVKSTNEPFVRNVARRKPLFNYSHQ
uniref:PPUP8388 n=1 Tax=Poeciliopsis prolifica TaxID=188132 RepID=A0A0S7ESM3_9TELE